MLQMKALYHNAVLDHEGPTVARWGPVEVTQRFIVFKP
jgi:hypothetical protein